MPKLKRLISLVNLLNSNLVVEFKKIKEHCGVSRSTAYRYLNALSEANIPVYYDREKHGYRLTEGVRFKIGDLSLNDCLLIVCGLQLLSEQANDYYGEELEGIIRKLASKECDYIDDFRKYLVKEIGLFSKHEDISGQLNSIFIAFAVRHKRRLTILSRDGNGGRKSSRLESPIIRFHEEWKVANSDKEAFSRDTPIKNILRVDIF